MRDTISRRDALAAIEAYEDEMLYGLPTLRAAINALPAVDDRAAIIEECARVADRYAHRDTGRDIAEAIRALAVPQ